MSVEAVKWATTKVPPGLVKLPARAVLAVFAEAADKDGRGSYQSHLTVAWRLGCTERNVTNHVRALVNAGLLIVSPDQSAVAHLAADVRPVVYNLPLHLVRTDTLEGARDEKRKRRRESRKGVVAKASETPDRSEEYFPTGPKNTSVSGTKNTSTPRHESSHHGPKDPSAPDRRILPHRSEGSFGQTIPNPSLNPVSSATPPKPPKSKRKPKAERHREDVETLCNALADGMVRNECKRPAITDAWRREARLLLDADGRDFTKALKLIDWCQSDPFWHRVIHSMPKFRLQYDRLRQEANAQYGRRPAPAQSDDEILAAVMRDIENSPAA